MSSQPFSSFPAFTSFPDLDPGPSKASSSKKEEPPKKERSRHKEERSKDKERKKDKKAKHRRSEHDVSDDERPRRKKERRTRDEYDRNHDMVEKEGGYRPPIETSTGPSLLFYSDRTGDQLNVTYGSLHAGDIPRYYLVCRGRKILGLPTETVVHRGRYDISTTYGGGKRKQPSLTDPSSRHLLNAPPTRRLISSSEDKHKYQEIDGFLRISSGKKRSGSPSYRSITQPKDKLYSDESDTSEDEGPDSSGSESDTTPLTSLQATLKELEQKLTSDPSSITTWLSLLTYSLSSIPLLSKNSVKARAEVSLSILSRALSAHPSNANSVSLHLKRLDAGSQIWAESKLASEWEESLKTVKGNEIWLEWLDWRIRNAQSGYGMEGVAEDVERVYGALRTRAAGRAEVGEEIELALLRVFWRAAVAVRDAGYIERATGMFQAQAELIFKIPKSLYAAPFEKQLDKLEEFWESEFPRVGEPNAGGWGSWHSSSSPAQWDPSAASLARVSQQQPPLRQQRNQLSNTVGADAYTRWAEDELRMDRDQAHHFPTRTTDDDQGEEDPYSTILFPDLRPFLVQIRSIKAKKVFRLIWLSFLGLHIPGLQGLICSPFDESRIGNPGALPEGGDFRSRSDSFFDDRWNCTYLSSPSYLTNIFPPHARSRLNRITADSQAGVLIGRERDYSSIFGPIKEWSYGVFGPLDGVGKNQWRMWMNQDLEGVNLESVRGVFGQCRMEGEAGNDEIGGEKEWDVLMIAFETAVNAKNGSKISKTVLAKDQTSLILWAAHGRIERIRGRLEEARKLYQTVLTSTPPDRAGQSILWWDWAEMEWLSGHSEVAIEVLVRSAGLQGTSGITILRIKRHFEDSISHCPLSRWKEREGWIKMRALLELVTSSVGAALGTIDVHLARMKTGTVEHESLTTASLMLVYHHGTILKNPVPLVVLRGRAERAIEAYPNNTFVLGMFLEGEKGQGVFGRVRAMLGGDGAGCGGKSVPRRVCEVWVASWDKGRWEAEEERTRNGLSAGVEDERCRGSSVLWRVYLEFEIRMGQTEKAKKLLFRAVNECPLVKELYLLAFGPLRSVFTDRELNDWGENMVEKGIRMRRGLDEALEGWRGAHGEQMEEAQDEGEVDEIEYNASELRRLRPY